MENNYIGKVLGNYRLIRLLGHGGFAAVYQAEHVHLNTLAAVKVLSGKLTGQSVQTFTTEAKTIATLRHPHILRILDFGFEQEQPFLVMDYAPAGTLRDRHTNGSIILLPTIISYVKQIAIALDFAHTQKLVHRDVKPENILINAGGTLLLSDFGIAAVAHSTTSMKTIDASGTVHYMAPEQFQGKPCPASDQYALAVIVYEWLCGKRPFQGDNFIAIGIQHATAPVPSLRERNEEVAPEVEESILKALAKDPKSRWETMLQFADALENAYKISQKRKMQEFMNRLKEGKIHFIGSSSDVMEEDQKHLKQEPAQEVIREEALPTLNGDHVQIQAQLTYTEEMIKDALLAVYYGKEGGLYPVKLSPDGRYCAATELKERLIWIWDITNGKNIYCYLGHSATKRENWGLAWSPNGQYLASGSDEKIIHALC